MKITNIKVPSTPFEIINNGNGYSAVFYTNVTESKDVDGMTGQEITTWDYETYTLPVINSSNLYASIESNLDEWIQKAKDYELDQESAKIRAYRDKLLNDCDTGYCTSDKWEAMDGLQHLGWNNYKQLLRDITKQDNFPYSVTFPVLPNFDISDISTLEGAKQLKLQEMSVYCQQTIYAGVDVVDTKGNEHFSLTVEDQANLSALAMAIGAGLTSVPYHANGQLCREFTASEFNSVYTTAKNFVTYNTTLCNHLNVWIKRCTTIDEINAITYTSTLPKDLLANFNTIMGITA